MTKRDVLRKRASINLLDLDIRWQFDPQQETTGWLPNFGGCRETFFDDTKSQFSPLPVEPTQEIEMAVEAAGLKIPAQSNFAQCC